MSSQYFSIQKLRFSLDFFSQKKAHALQNKISALYQQQLHTLLQDFFSGAIPEDRLIRKDSLLLDLGPIPYDELESELPGRLEKALAEQFYFLAENEYNTPNWQASGFETLPVAAGYESLLEYFLMNGVFPWQASGQPQFTWQSILHQLYERDRNQLGIRLKALGRQRLVRHRLAYQSWEEDLHKIITAVEPVEAPAILAYKKNIENIQQKKQLVKSDITGFKQALAFFILTYLLEEKGSLFSKKMFIKSVLLQMAAHYNISYLVLLALLHEALPPKKQSSKDAKSLFELVNELQQEALPGATSPAPAITGTNQQASLLTDKLEIIKYYLQQGTLPVWSVPVSPEALAAHLISAVQAAPATVKEILFSLATNTTALERLIHLLGYSNFTDFINLLNPGDASFMERHLELLALWQEQGVLISHSGSGFTAITRKMTLLYLLANKNNTVNREAFLQNSITYLAGQNNSTPASVAKSLATVAAALIEKGKSDAEYAFILHYLQYLSTQDLSANNIPALAVHLESSVEPTGNANSLTDVLYYFLQYGAMPWWGRIYYNQSPEKLLERLEAASAAGALLILKRAGLQAGTRRRFLWQFSAPLVYRLFAQLPDWYLVPDRLEEIIQLIEALPAFAHLSQLTLQHLLLEAVWTGYIAREYQAFGHEYFYATVLEHLAKLATLDKNKLTRLLQEAILTEKAALAPAAIKPGLLLLPKIPMVPLYTRKDYLLYQQIKARYTSAAHQVTSQGLDSTKAFPNLTKIPSLTTEIIRRLLQQDNLTEPLKQLLLVFPERWEEQLPLLSADDAIMLLQFTAKEKNYETTKADELSLTLLPQLIHLLPSGKTALATLEILLQLIIRSRKAFNLSNLLPEGLLWHLLWHHYQQQQFTRFKEQEFINLVLKQVALLFEQQPAEIILHWQTYQQAAFSDIASYQTINQLEQAISHFTTTGTTSSALYPTEIITGKNLYPNLDTLINQYTGTTTGQTGPDRVQATLNLLEYYLRWNRLPDSLAPMSETDLDNRLEEMLLLLYHENRDALMRLLRSEKHTATARMRLHHLFVPNRKGGDHKQLSLLLDDYLEQDALHYLKEMHSDRDILNAEHALKPALDRLLEKAQGGKAEELNQLLQSVALTRYIARQYDAKTVQWLLKNRPGAVKKIHELSVAVNKLLVNLITDTAEKNRLQLVLNEANLFYFSNSTYPANSTAYIRDLFRYMSRSAYSTAGLFPLLLTKINTITNLDAKSEKLVQAIRQELEQHLQIREQQEAIQNQLAAEALRAREADAAALQQKIQQELLRQKEKEEQTTKKKPPAPLETGTKLYVTNAGLVLLHPFLSTYFTRLNLMEKGQFVNREAQARAVHLLQYLVYNTSQHPEHELVLNKILCNYPLPEPLPLEITVEPHEADLTAELLQVVIQRAGKIGGSSVDGFRVSFLHREGALTETEEAWTLRVEQRSYDLLLQTLPWAFGMIKFGWMDKPLYVEWI